MWTWRSTCAAQAPLPAYEQAERQGPWWALVMILNAKLEGRRRNHVAETSCIAQSPPRILVAVSPEVVQATEDVGGGYLPQRILRRRL